MEIPGIVASGLGKGAYFVALDWVQARLLELMGTLPYPGTLNLRVAPESRDLLFAQRQRFAPIMPPGEQNCPGYLVAVSLRGAAQVETPAWAVIPDATAHADIIEIVSPHFLRERLALTDGDCLHLAVRFA